jgi:AraC-like DNA-binding protein
MKNPAATARNRIAGESLAQTFSVGAGQVEALFDALPNVVFFIKDMSGRYTHANLTLVRRLGLARRAEVIGHHADQLFAAPLGHGYAGQDRRVLAGEALENQLEVHLFPSRAPGWCITSKYPLRAGAEITGLMGLSRDIGQPEGSDPVYGRLRRVHEHMRTHYAERLRVPALAERAGMSVAQLERHFQRLFQLTPQQVLAKLRIEAAMRLLGGSTRIADIGQACGFADQSAFARQFKAIVGITPSAWRRVAHARGDVPD